MKNMDTVRCDEWKERRTLRFKVGDSVVFRDGTTGTIKQAGDVGNIYFDYDMRHHQRGCRVLISERQMRDAKLI